MCLGFFQGFATEQLDGQNVRLTIRKYTIVRIEKRRNPTKAQKAIGILNPWYVDADTTDPADKWICEAAQNTSVDYWSDGEHVCEAIGPNIQGNPLELIKLICVPLLTNAPLIRNVPRNYEGLKTVLYSLDSAFSPGHLAEGIVFHHPDGRMAKIKRKDFDYGEV